MLHPISSRLIISADLLIDCVFPDPKKFFLATCLLVPVSHDFKCLNSLVASPLAFEMHEVLDSSSSSLFRFVVGALSLRTQATGRMLSFDPSLPQVIPISRL